LPLILARRDDEFFDVYIFLLVFSISFEEIILVAIEENVGNCCPYRHTLWDSFRDNGDFHFSSGRLVTVEDPLANAFPNYANSSLAYKRVVRVLRSLRAPAQALGHTSESSITTTHLRCQGFITNDDSR
jgi:hypothetical protein